MPKAKTNKEFIKEAKQVHGNKYDYSKTIYTKAKETVVIICPDHGEFEQTAQKHTSGQGCKTCGKRKISSKKRFSKDKFVEKAKQVHNNKYDYSLTNYYSCYDRITIVCPFHGAFVQEASKHISGIGCQKCSRERSGNKRKLDKEEFIRRSKLVHADKYDYSDTEYTMYKNNVKIFCPKHGTFKQSPNNHLQGKGCPQCKAEKLSVFNEKWLIENPDKVDESATIYLIKLKSNKETFLKLGMTSRSITERFQYTMHFYDYETIQEYLTNMKTAINIEEIAKEKFHKFKYDPENRFPGWTECYDIDALNDLSNLLNQHI